MGKILEDYYVIVQKSGGFQAAIRLAMLTKISGVKAASLPDTTENLQLFKDSIKEIFGEDITTLQEKIKNNKVLS